MSTSDQDVRVIHADCAKALRKMSANKFSAVVTDPPYGLSFAGEKWDTTVPLKDTWKECLRVLVPGGHALIFGGSRTYHRLACEVEDAGFEIRDCIMWLRADGCFPKTGDVGKIVDKAITGTKRKQRRSSPAPRNGRFNGGFTLKVSNSKLQRTDPTTDEGMRWFGYGSTLRTVYEPILVARKPLDGGLGENVLRHGAGALNLLGCNNDTGKQRKTTRVDGFTGSTGKRYLDKANLGPGPTNVVVDDVVARDQLRNAPAFYYVNKATISSDVTHPTVKPIDLMRWLIRLVRVPTKNLILDPFAGSGTTGVAARLEDVPCVLIEREEKYVQVINQRLSGVGSRLGLAVSARR